MNDVRLTGLLDGKLTLIHSAGLGNAAALQGVFH